MMTNWSTQAWGKAWDLDAAVNKEVAAVNKEVATTNKEVAAVNKEVAAPKKEVVMEDGNHVNMELNNVKLHYKLYWNNVQLFACLSFHGLALVCR